MMKLHLSFILKPILNAHCKVVMEEVVSAKVTPGGTHTSLSIGNGAMTDDLDGLNCMGHTSYIDADTPLYRVFRRN